MITVNFNDIFNKVIDKDQPILIERENKDDNLILLTAKKYNEILEELKRLKYWHDIDKRISEINTGKGKYHDLIEVDDE